jgi:hypothetical protein
VAEDTAVVEVSTAARSGLEAFTEVESMPVA